MRWKGKEPKGKTMSIASKLVVCNFLVFSNEPAGYAYFFAHSTRFLDSSAEVLVRVSRECLQGAIALNALTTVSKRPWTEATVRLAEELFLRSAPSKEAMRLIVFAIERNAPLLPSSLR